MRTDDDALFGELEPPPGGVERFRRRLARQGEVSRRPIGPFLMAGLAVSVLAIVVIGLLRQTHDAVPAPGSVYQARDFDRLLGRPMERTELSVSIDNESVAVTETPSKNPRIRIYEIERD